MCVYMKKKYMLSTLTKAVNHYELIDDYNFFSGICQDKIVP